MGIYGFSRSLAKKFPLIVEDCIEENPCRAGGKNCNFDNLYLDVNSIIHPCANPEGTAPVPNSENEIFAAIFQYIDRVFAIVRPRRLLYMAIDGVAPSAKMNDQRSSRFSRARARFQQPFDRNCVMPGTEFMSRLTEALHYYIHARLHNEPGWRSLQVFLSDANVPGEGEHKIMDFIRRQRAQLAQDPNTRHCVFSPDADLILLGLATHELHFTIIREEFRESVAAPHRRPDFVFVRLNVLREYLKRELRLDERSICYNFERALDDFVFMCLILGNDFLPRLPNLPSTDRGIERLIRIYKNVVHETCCWVTSSGVVLLDQMRLIMRDLGRWEDANFKSRRSSQLYFRQLRRKENPSANGLPDSEDEADATDEVRLWEDGWHNRYYRSKFGVAVEGNRDFPKQVASHYARGLCWVLHYYYRGCASWSWYYPHHYPPFASDFVNIAGVNNDDFVQPPTEPLKPLEQLMAVLPATSSSLVPQSWRGLMTNPNSPIISFYPVDFRVDLNGKKFAWMGVVLLPFVDEALLLKTLESVYPSLTPEERKRNERDPDRLFVRSTHPVAALIQSLYVSEQEGIETDAEARLTGGVGGVYKRDNLASQPGEDVPSPVQLPQFQTLAQCQVASCCYANPALPRGHRFRAQRLQGARPPLPYCASMAAEGAGRPSVASVQPPSSESGGSR